MITYKYVAKAPDGSKVTGTVEAYNEIDAADRIKQNYGIILRLEQAKEESESLLSRSIGGKRLNNKAFLVMCSQFATIIGAGIPVSRAVKLVAAKMNDKTLNNMLVKVGEDVEAGRSLSAAFTERGGDFLPSAFIETISAGEASGNLGKSFRTVFEHFDKKAKTAGKVRSAMGYPLFVLAIAVVVVIILMVKVVPALTSVFESYSAEIPALTRLLIDIASFFSRYWLVMAAVAAAIFIFVKIYGRSETGRLNLSKLLLKLPVLGNIAELTAASEFSNTLALMLSSGMPLTRALNITGRTMSNYYKSAEVSKLATKIEEGHSLGASMREAGVMPDILVDMVSVGEETGEMESSLRDVAEYYDSELDTATKSAISKLEPIMLLILAVVAGFIVISVYVGMFSMYSVM